MSKRKAVKKPRKQRVPRGPRASRAKSAPAPPPDSRLNQSQTIVLSQADNAALVKALMQMNRGEQQPATVINNTANPTTNPTVNPMLTSTQPQQAAQPIRTQVGRVIPPYVPRQLFRENEPRLPQQTPQRMPNTPLQSTPPVAGEEFARDGLMGDVRQTTANVAGVVGRGALATSSLLGRAAMATGSDMMNLGRTVLDAAPTDDIESQTPAPESPDASQGFTYRRGGVTYHTPNMDEEGLPVFNPNSPVEPHYGAEPPPPGIAGRAWGALRAWYGGSLQERIDRESEAAVTRVNDHLSAYEHQLREQSAARREMNPLPEVPPPSTPVFPPINDTPVESPAPPPVAQPRRPRTRSMGPVSPQLDERNYAPVRQSVVPRSERDFAPNGLPYLEEEQSFDFAGDRMPNFRGGGGGGGGGGGRYQTMSDFVANVMPRPAPLDANPLAMGADEERGLVDEIVNDPAVSGMRRRKQVSYRY